MQFPYVPVGPNLSRPFASVWVHGPTRAILVDGLLDTGADRVLLPERIAKAIGIDTSNLASAPSMQGMTGQLVHCGICNLALELRRQATTIVWKTEVAIALGKIRYPYWGIQGFLEFFRAKFDGPNRVVTLAAGGNLPAAPPPP